MLIDLTNSPTRPGATVDLHSPVAELKRPASDVAESDVAAAASRGPSPKKQMTDGVKSGKAEEAVKASAAVAVPFDEEVLFGPLLAAAVKSDSATSLAGRFSSATGERRSSSATCAPSSSLKDPEEMEGEDDECQFIGRTGVASPSCGPASGASRTVPQLGSSIEPLLLSWPRCGPVAGGAAPADQSVSRKSGTVGNKRVFAPPRCAPPSGAHCSAPPGLVHLVIG